MPWMCKEACYLPAKEGGSSLLNWHAHVKALQVKIWLQYRDASRNEWKLILELWALESLWGGARERGLKLNEAHNYRDKKNN